MKHVLITVQFLAEVDDDATASRLHLDLGLRRAKVFEDLGSYEEEVGKTIEYQTIRSESTKLRKLL
jgi:hypothetical protein